MVEVTCQHGVGAVTVTRVIEVAGVSRRTFYELFDDCSDCLLAAIDDAVEVAVERVTAAPAGEARWVDRMRAGLFAALEFIDEEPELARLCIVDAMGAGPVALARRGEVVDRMARAIEEGGNAVRVARTVPPFLAEGVVGGIFGVVHSHLLRPDPGAAVELLNALMSMLVLPYLGYPAALRELGKPRPRVAPSARVSDPATEPLANLKVRLTYRTAMVLAVIHAQDGLSNFEIGARGGISDQGQISKLLARLARAALIENRAGDQPNGGPNSWHLTASGEALARLLGRDAKGAGD